MSFILVLLFIGSALSSPQGYYYALKNTVLPEQDQVIQQVLQNPQTNFFTESTTNNVPSTQLWSQTQEQNLELQSTGPFINNYGYQVHAPVVSSFTTQLEPSRYVENTGLSPQSTHSSHLQAQIPPKENHMEYNKEFYFISAAPKKELDYEDVTSSLNKLKKNLRVVFIKAPENNGVLNAAAKLLQESQANDKTLIYVLAKQHSAADLAKKLQQNKDNSPSIEPEVVFVKYRTAQEADEAQRTIQSQYASLNGPNLINIHAIAPVQDFTKHSQLQYLPPSNEA